MERVQNYWIKLKETIDHEDYDLINKLQKQCIDKDKTALKLELDYKFGFNIENGKISSIENVNEFMFFESFCKDFLIRLKFPE
jgi:hypothetical protein